MLRQSGGEIEDLVDGVTRGAGVYRVLGVLNRLLPRVSLFDRCCEYF
jgi:hypothetical protein